MRKTFELALDFTRPDVICFLGDLLDEGNIASTHDFQSYVKRFRSIYQEKQYISVNTIKILKNFCSFLIIFFCYILVYSFTW